MLVDPCMLPAACYPLSLWQVRQSLRRPSALCFAPHPRDLVSMCSRLLPQVCRVTCCGMTNFQQHCNSKKHLRKAAAAGAAAIPDMGSPGCPDSLADDPAEGLQSVNPTYVGLQAQCRTYCKQVGIQPLPASMFNSPPFSLTAFHWLWNWNQ